MKVFLLLLAFFATQDASAKRVSVAGTQSIAAYQLAKLSASNATGPLKWEVFQLVPVSSYSAGNDFVFTAALGPYQIRLTAANGSNWWSIQFTPPGDGPLVPPAPTPAPPSPTPAPTPIPLPPGNQPAPDPDTGFIYPDIPVSQFAGDVAKAAKLSKVAGAREAKAMALLYGFIAAKIEMDGLRPVPGLSTLSQATALVKAEQSALLGTTPLKSLKDSFPDVAKLASEEFGRIMGPLVSRDAQTALSPATRAAYVAFLRQVEGGFELASRTGQIDPTPPRPAPQ